MRAVEFSEFGNPRDVLRLVERPVPEPGPGQVRVRLTHRPIHPSDLLTVTGEYGRLPALPATPGQEGTGVIDALGANVSGWNIGQRIIPLGVPGTWRDYVIADAQRLLPVPDSVSDTTAAQFVANPVTAWVMLENELDLQEGDWVLQTAAGSTLGRIVIQMAELQGYKTINLVRRREQVDELLGLGADAAICTKDEDVVAQVRSLTGDGAKGALEAVGGETGALALSALKAGGTMIVYGMLSREPIPAHSGEMLFRGTAMRGFWLSHWFRVTPPAVVSQTLMTLMQHMAAGHLVPPVEAEYDLSDLQGAIANAEQSGRQGKVILTS